MDERITGRTASPGYAAGRIHLLDLLTQAGTQIYPDPEGDQAPDIPLEPAVGDPTTGSPEAKVPASRDAASRQPAGEPATRNPTAEADLLVGAMQVAVDEVRALIALLDVDATLNRDAIGILGFQLAFMQDEALAAPALQAIAGGRSAVEAWRTALNDQIRWYQTAEDEYFRARASDLGDIRDRVLACLQRGALRMRTTGSRQYRRARCWWRGTCRRRGSWRSSRAGWAPCCSCRAVRRAMSRCLRAPAGCP